eukprot:CAMPEP_0194281444 /NCGR_PEP_ID=MMETSP0169-20130528/20710_1 /TAXON_ID=218684 /ORGANISM="Corethron pennatum, Strain L29A3" /LENGTH=779 /DNA_ID=CAMNT_0039026501 /DNA_START=55 /DNA_END=2394 /DNA_ORIENTATION=+
MIPSDRDNLKQSSTQKKNDRGRSPFFRGKSQDDALSNASSVSTDMESNLIPTKHRRRRGNSAKYDRTRSFPVGKTADYDAQSITSSSSSDTDFVNLRSKSPRNSGTKVSHITKKKKGTKLGPKSLRKSESAPIKELKKKPRTSSRSKANSPRATSRQKTPRKSVSATIQEDTAKILNVSPRQKSSPWKSNLFEEDQKTTHVNSRVKSSRKSRSAGVEEIDPKSRNKSSPRKLSQKISFTKSRSPQKSNSTIKEGQTSSKIGDQKNKSGMKSKKSPISRAKSMSPQRMKYDLDKIDELGNIEKTSWRWGAKPNNIERVRSNPTSLSSRSPSFFVSSRTSSPTIKKFSASPVEGRIKLQKINVKGTKLKNKIGIHPRDRKSESRKGVRFSSASFSDVENRREESWYSGSMETDDVRTMEDSFAASAIEAKRSQGNPAKTRFHSKAKLKKALNLIQDSMCDESGGDNFDENTRDETRDETVDRDDYDEEGENENDESTREREDFEGANNAKDDAACRPSNIFTHMCYCFEMKDNNDTNALRNDSNENEMDMGENSQSFDQFAVNAIEKSLLKGGRDINQLNSEINYLYKNIPTVGQNQCDEESKKKLKKGIFKIQSKKKQGKGLSNFVAFLSPIKLGSRKRSGKGKKSEMEYEEEESVESNFNDAFRFESESSEEESEAEVSREMKNKKKKEKKMKTNRNNKPNREEKTRNKRSGRGEKGGKEQVLAKLVKPGVPVPEDTVADMILEFIYPMFMVCDHTELDETIKDSKKQMKLMRSLQHNK